MSEARDTGSPVAGSGFDLQAPAPSRRRLAIPRFGWGILVLPAIILLALVFLLPLLHLALMSLHRRIGMGLVDPAWTTVNYVAFLTDRFYLGIVLETVGLGLVVLAVSIVIAYPVAYVLARSRSRWRGTLIFAVMSPLLISVVIRNLGWLPVLSDGGLANWLLLKTGIVSHPLRLISSYTGVVIGLVHALSPFMILSLMTVIQRIEPEIEEAALSLGAGPIETFWRVVLPLSRPGLLGGSLLVFTVVLSAFTTPAMMGGNHVLVMATYIAQQIRGSLNYPAGATAAVVLLVLTGALAAAAMRLGRARS